MIRFSKGLRALNWKYTVTEVLLIFLGITLAIWFNNWNQNRIDRNKKSQYLKELKSDLQSDIDELTRLIDANNVRMKRINLLNEALHFTGRIANCDSIQNYVASASFINVFIGSSTVFEDLENTGNLFLVESQVRRKMMKYYSKVNSIKKYEDLNSTFHINTIGPFLKQYWNTGALFRIGQDQKDLNKNLMINDCENTLQKLKDFQSDHQLKQELMNHTNFSYYIMNQNNGEYEIMRNEVNQLIDLIEKEK